MKVPIGKIGGKTVYSMIFMRSLDEWKNLRGLKAWWAWMDEGDIAPEESYEMIKSRISDHADGKMLITSTLDMDSWINRLINQPLLAGKIDNAEIISWPSNERPGYPQEEWERMKAEMDPVQFARDYEGKFSFESGLVYGDVLKYGIINSLPEGVTILASFYGIDYGLNHPTVIMVMGYGSDQNWYVLNEFVSPMMSVDDINEQLKSNLSIFRPVYGDPWATYYDPAGGVATLSLTQDVFPIPAVKDIPATITLVRNFIHQRRVYVLSHCDKLIRELAVYSFQRGKSLPEDKNDHCSQTLGYIIFNGWLLTDGLTAPELPKAKNRIEMDLEAKGLLKDGIFQNILPSEEYSIY